MHDDFRLRLAEHGEEQAIVGFVNAHWGEEHPLVNRRQLFDYYYRSKPGRLNFVLAEQNGSIAALAGFIDSNNQSVPDGWVSLLLAQKAAGGAGLELLCGMQALTGHRFLACNNIRKRVQALYRFAGYETGRMAHFYRLAKRAEYHVALVQNPYIPPLAAGSASLMLFETAQALSSSGFTPPRAARPYKDMWYIHRRYFGHPNQSYRVYGVYPAAAPTPQALLVLRPNPVGQSAVLRMVDFIGPTELLTQIQGHFDALLDEYGAEYMDCYCALPGNGLLLQAGFCERTEDDPNTIPNYLNPLLRENTEYYYAAQPSPQFSMFKADGDQDRS